jgi:hypothetical protein
MSGVLHQHYLDVASARDLGTFHRRLVDFAEHIDFPRVNALLVVEQPGSHAAVIPVHNVHAEFEDDVDPVRL